jgi:hypothetical protein
LPLFAAVCRFRVWGGRQEKWHDIENVGDSKKKAAKLPAGLSEQSLPPQKGQPPNPRKEDLSITGIGDNSQFILNSNILIHRK